jgi:4-alpha-glucanotransferase
MRYAGILRLDHIMGLYRLFWIPHGLGAKNGAYVHYRSKELFALMNLESQRNRCTLIGEDLGTVPPVIREKMESHGIMGIYVQQIELDTKFEAQFGHPFRPIPRNSIASINTHDMPPFASYWCDTDLDECERIGLLSPNEKREEKERRGAQKGRLFAYLERNGFFRSASREFGEILRAIHALLGRSHAKAMIVNLEDLWLETLRQNTPATRSDQLPNWRRKMRYKVEELKQHFTGVLADIVSLRRGGN